LRRVVAGRIVALMLLLSLSLLLSAEPDLSASVTREVARSECRLRDAEEAITVCGRRDEQKRYQVTDPNAPYDPRGQVEGVMTERMGWISEGESGPETCSGIGLGGHTGCFAKDFRKKLQQKGWLVR
jgi:hypothetical protein